MLEDVVVAWNGSQRSRAALQWTLDRPSTRSVRLLRAIPDDDIGTDIEPGVRLVLEAELDRLRQARSDLTFSWAIVHGDVESVLRSEAVPGRLLVLGTGGPAGRLLPHRSAMLARIVRGAPGPLCLVPPASAAPTDTVVAGFDNTSAGHAAAGVAASEAATAGAAVLLVHVADPSPHRSTADDVPIERTSREIVARFPHLLVRQRQVTGDVQAELHRAASAGALLVLGRHDEPGPGARLEWQAVLGNTSCPVLLVPEIEATLPLTR